MHNSIYLVLVVGTTMKVPGMKRLVTEFCRAAKVRPASTVIWVSRYLSLFARRNYLGLMDVELKA